MMDGRRSTCPALHIGTKVFRAVDLYGLRHGDGCADSIGSNIRFAPAPAMFEMNFATLLDRSVVAACLHYET